MGRGGGKTGGGGMSRGGSRGFSSGRSSGGSSRRTSSGSSGRGGLSFGRNAGRMSPPPGRRTPPPPPPGRSWRYGPIFRPTTIFVGNGSGSNNRNSENMSTYRSKEKKKGVPGWYKVLCVIMAFLVVRLFGSAVSAGMKAANSETREKLGAEACISTDKVIDDQIGWLIDVKTVKEGMRYFYDKTGVQPYLLICDNLNGKRGEITDDEAKNCLKELYDSMYKDEGHMIFVFMEYEESQYITFIYTGRSADSVIDADARGIMLDKADQYYTDSSLSDEEYFEKIFHDSADKIMVDASGYTLMALLSAAAGVVIIIIMAAGLLGFKVNEQKETEDIAFKG